MYIEKKIMGYILDLWISAKNILQVLTGSASKAASNMSIAEQVVASCILVRNKWTRAQNCEWN